MNARIVAADSAEWRARAQALGDVYHDPAYLAAYAGNDRALVAMVERGDASLAVPLIARPLPTAIGGDGWMDAESPHGYASPIATGDATMLWETLPPLLAGERIVNAFLRFHPLDECPFPASVQIGGERTTAWIPLHEGRANAFAGKACETHRQRVRRAQALGLVARVERPIGDAALSAFRRIYDRTMTRLGADRSYLYDDAYYARLRGLGDRLGLVTVGSPSGEIGYASLFLAGRRWLHYHLSGRTDDCHSAAGHLAFEAAADWAAADSLAGVHLGGGISDDPADPLLAYKQRVARCRACFRVAGIVADAVRHGALIEAWRQATGGSPRWFQAYRQPAPAEPRASAAGAADNKAGA